MMRLAILVVLTGITAFLTGCTNVAVSGAQALYNRHSLQKSFQDQFITLEAFKRLKIKDDAFKNANVVVATCNCEVLLTGQVPEASLRMKAEQIVKAIPKVKAVYNLLTIANPSSSLTRMSDSWITTKIKTKLLAANVETNEVKVVTENGVVYLMGILKPDEAEAAVNIARTTDGVTKVVRMISYITISKHLPATGAPASSTG